ncbi:hypothetical protein GGI15_002144 [Coemansia interrupta]|uniref:Uncharacterized protein n=1 Tax=Coemansia interrupta TaxID=1126814 RepID=A0A9W8HFE0_9FUNG|nr:hypothetical protein GGI15_002144 [Coemansia interrupta]
MSLPALLSRRHLVHTSFTLKNCLRFKQTLAEKTLVSGATDPQIVFEALPSNAVRMLKFMSLTGSALACTSTAAAAISQYQGQLSDTDLGIVSLALASAVSMASTVAVTKLFGPFVTRITLLPTISKRGMVIDRHGLPKFDSIIANSAKGAGRITADTEVVLHSPGLLGFTTNSTRVRVGDLAPSSRRFRTWELKSEAVAMRKEQGVRTPVTIFTILWKSTRNSPTKRIMEEINSIVGAT